MAFEAAAARARLAAEFASQRSEASALSASHPVCRARCHSMAVRVNNIVALDSGVE